jgi:hypothetical protein|tara:strand:- start:199 stop:567 length:369 start_codon:yes stop_codon:yes gene_type:complete
MMRPVILHGKEGDENFFNQLLQIAIPSLACWVLMFYGLFHLWLNILGEVTYFADRLFYKVSERRSECCVGVSADSVIGLFLKFFFEFSNGVHMSLIWIFSEQSLCAKRCAWPNPPPCSSLSV